MAKSRQQKEEALQQLSEKLDSKGVVFFNYGGLSVNKFEELRGKLREENALVTVAKRNLLMLALKNRNVELSEDVVTGPVAVAVGDDEVLPAKIIAEYKKDHEQIEFYGGLLESAFIDTTQVEQMATLPTKTELLAQVVGSLNAPISGFVNVLAGNMRGLVNALNAIKDQKSE